jgi:hypothetical protein
MVQHISQFHIKAGYASRDGADYFDDRPYATSDVVHQPDAYALAAHLALHYGADTIVDVGCGSARKLIALEGFRKVGVDRGLNLDYCKRSFPNETWVEADLERATGYILEEDLLARSVVICADVVEHLVDPTSLLKLLRRFAGLARAVLITTPDRDLVRGAYDMGPPVNPAHIREWNLDEFVRLLEANDLNPAFVGRTVNNNQDLEKKTIIAIVDGIDVAQVAPSEFRPLALIATYNDRDLVESVVVKLLNDNIDVHILDNWSDDGTFERLREIQASCVGLSLERFPAEGPSRYYEWRAILRRKEEIARTHPGRWIIHQDSDEVRCAPWRQCSFRQGIFSVDRAKFNAIDFTVLDFRPVDDGFVEGADPETALPGFEFGRRPGHFLQIKAWRQGAESVRLAETGGHDAQFSGQRVFPYKFLLKHYPIRSSEQGRRKVFVERRGRFSPQERADGWHIQYDHWQADEHFVWRRDQLITFDQAETPRDFLVELISGIGIVRQDSAI